MVVMFISSKEKKELFERLEALEEKFSVLTETLNYLETGVSRKRRPMTQEHRSAISARMKEWHAKRREGKV